MFVGTACQTIVENIKFETYSNNNLSKKDPATRHVLKTKFSFKSF